MQGLGRSLLLVGLFLVVAGILLLLADRLGLPLGRLPGDIAFRGKHVSVFAPIATMIIVSLLLTVVMNLLFRWFR